MVSVLAALAALALAGCGSSKHNSSGANSSSATASQSPSAAGSGGPVAGAQAQIKQNWEKFFNGATSADEKVALLQNGDQFQQAIQGQANSAIAKSAGATVSAVSVSGSQAEVTYDVTLGGKSALSGQKGQAVLEGGTWKVSDASFCQLLALENGGNTSGLPPACGAAASASPSA